MKRLKFFIGSTLNYLLPKRASKLSKKGITITLDKNLNKADLFMRYALLKKAEKNQDHELLAQFHSNFWKNQGQIFFSKPKDTLNSCFLPNTVDLLKKLKARLTGRLDNYTMIEIGTGQGDVINYLSTEFSEINRFVGIDLSLTQTEINNYNYRENKKLEFVAADGYEWIKSNITDNLVLFTFGGVFEYYSEKRLVDFLGYLSKLNHVTLVVVEPIGISVDFKSNPKSQPYGYERSFSHNYIKLFEEAGFVLWHKSQIDYSTYIYFTAIGVEKGKKSVLANNNGEAISLSTERISNILITEDH